MQQRAYSQEHKQRWNNIRQQNEKKNFALYFFVLFKTNIQTVSKVSYSHYPKEGNIIYQDVRIRYKYSIKIYFSVNTVSFVRQKVL